MRAERANSYTTWYTCPLRDPSLSRDCTIITFWTICFFLGCAGTMSCRSWWGPIRRITRIARRTAPTSTWTSSSRRRSSPSTCIGWTATTICTTRTFAGRAPASSSIRTSGAGCAPCCTTTVRRNITRTWTSGGEGTGCARPTRGGNTTSHVRRTPEEERPPRGCV